MAPPDDPASHPEERRGRVGTVAGALVTAVAMAAAVAFGVSRADDPGKVVREVVALHDMGAQGPPPVPVPDPGVRDGFADFATRSRWVPAGARTDGVEGREAATIFWERAGRRIAYTRVSGTPVDAPDDARRTGRRGTLLRSIDLGGRTAVVWVENDHTAVISAVGISRAALYNLAGGRALR